MIALERDCLKAAIKHLMADADDPNWTWDGGMELLGALVKTPASGRTAELKQLLAKCQPNT